MKPNYFNLVNFSLMWIIKMKTVSQKKKERKKEMKGFHETP